MPLKITIKGIDELCKALSNANAKLQSATIRVMVDSMKDAVEDARATASERGWKLEDKILITRIDSQDLIVEGGCYAPYAGFPEFGTMKQHAQPFWRPAVWSQFYAMRHKLLTTIAELYR